MTNDDFDYKELGRWVDIMNKRGHAVEFARVTEEDKRIVGRSTAQEFAYAVQHKYGLELTDIESNISDPPDCVACSNGRLLSLELVELVNPVILKKISQARRNDGKTISASGKLFNEAQWTQELFFDRVNKCLDKKHYRYIRKRQAFDVLIIHSAEPWLSPVQVDAWLSKRSFESRTTFKTAYLLLRYYPGYSEHWPVFHLFGSI